MTTMQKPAVRKRTRKTKQEMGEEKIIKDKFAEERRSTSLLVPMNDLQSK